MADEHLSSLFHDGKEPGALRTIGEVAKALGIRQHVLRYWEEQFPNLRPLKRSGGRRYYRTEDIQLVATIDRLVHREGYTLRGARLAIGGGGKAAGGGAVAETSGISQAAGTLVGALPKAITPAGAQRLRAVRDLLASALAAA